MNDIIDQKMESLKSEYDKLYPEVQEKGKRLEEILSQHKVLSDIKNDIENAVKSSEAVIIKKKGTK